MSCPRLTPLLLLVALATCAITIPADADPTWVATPPAGLVNQPIGLLFANTTVDSVYINSTVWVVRDSQNRLVAKFDFQLAAFWPVPPGGVIPGGFTPTYPDAFTATVYWYTRAGGGGGRIRFTPRASTSRCSTAP